MTSTKKAAVLPNFFRNTGTEALSSGLLKIVYRCVMHNLWLFVALAFQS